MSGSQPIRVRTDFNGLFGELLCLSHSKTCRGPEGEEVVVHEGMTLTAFDEDVDDDGNPDNLIASGAAERSPKWLASEGSRWVLRIDHNGVRHESDLRNQSG